MAEKNTQSIAKQDKAVPAEKTANTLVPPVDICENSDGVTLFADLPGVGKEGLNVHIDKDTLEISGKREPETEPSTENYYTEMPKNDYYRAFTIGEEIDREKISAQLTNGVLKVVLPKAERAKPKKIDIKFS
jgi:HSP20 family molecular chaperone IbpA